ncbi:MAG: dihydropteridine reductase [Firmicutes bacterium]|uniref:Dihydropteridine reductase n=1 Tax=Candidatus Onthovivens merdipullorum TaxID=2840889 RepID=A0A9D9DJB8_9BACL|nr:dihydropteridine reductase [Candidatus Onthovivens merdipullorum]
MKNLEEERLRATYTPRVETNIDKALKLEKHMKLPVYIFTYILGIFGALILGVGMCLSLEVFGSNTIYMIIGIILGIIGIVIVAVNYPLYLYFLKKRKEKYGSAILVILNENK